MIQRRQRKEKWSEIDKKKLRKGAKDKDKRTERTKVTR